MNLDLLCSTWILAWTNLAVDNIHVSGVMLLSSFVTWRKSIPLRHNQIQYDKQSFSEVYYVLNKCPKSILWIKCDVNFHNNCFLNILCVILRQHSGSCKNIFSLPGHMGFTHKQHMEQVKSFNAKVKTQSDHYFLVGVGDSGIEPFPTQSCRIWCTAGSYPARLGNDMIRSWRVEGTKERRRRKWASALIALWCTTIIYRKRFILCSFLQGSSVSWEVYLLGLLALTPAGMCMYVRSRLNFI